MQLLPLPFLLWLPGVRCLLGGRYVSLWRAKQPS